MMNTQAEPRERLQLAILATPRSGNTWLRALLKTAYRLEEYAALHIADIPWSELPARSIVNLHHLPSEMLRERMSNCRTIVIARHPLDTLISILHFAAQRTKTAGWISGLGGNEDGIRDVAPLSAEFRKYAVGPRAAALLSVSAAWWNEPGAIRTRYEELVADTASELGRIAAEVGTPSAVPIGDAVAQCGFDRMRRTNDIYTVHAWKSQPGLWKRLIPASFAQEIAHAHREVFETLGYTCDPDASLTEADAMLNWYRLEAETNKRDKEQLRQFIADLKHAALEARREQRAALQEHQARFAASETKRREIVERLKGEIAQRNDALDRAKNHSTSLAEQLAKSQARLLELRIQLGDAHASREEVLAQLDRARDDLGEIEKQLQVAHALLAGTGETGLAIARRLSRLSARLPTAAYGAKRVVNAVRRIGRAA
jgi:hypothetical protein